ncbi:MAG: lactate racemase domain-containing protein [Anaerolineae bacterium]
MIARQAPIGQILDEAAIREAIYTGLAGKFTGARVLALIPDHTRTIPLPKLFPLIVDALGDTRQLDFMVALGTHPPLSDEAIHHLIGITADERATTYRSIGLLNHDWANPDALMQIGTITQDQVKAIAGDVWHPSLGGDVPIRINRRITDYDHLLIIGPTFPHEVIGFSGGAKYLFPGISGADMINVTHWLGALMTILNVIGIKDTPVRAMVNAAAAMVPTPITLLSMVVVSHGDQKDALAGIFIGDHLSAWSAAADLSSQRHIVWLDQPFDRVLSHAPPMYDELWTAAKAMYKLEPAIRDGGEVIVYAPQLATVSHVHGKYIYEAGYHVRDYYLKQWDRFGHLPLGVLAHGTHLRGSGTYENGVEYARINVTLATAISRADCEILSLGYADPTAIDPRAFAGDGLLYVPKAGEMLYRVRPK